MKSKIIITAKAQSIVFLFLGKKKNRKRKLKGQDVSANISKVINEEGTGQKESTDVQAPKRKRRRRKSRGSCEEKSNVGQKEIIPKEEKINEKCVGYLFTSSFQIKRIKWFY